MASFCSKCGAQQAGDSNFCPGCGAQAGAAGMQTAPPMPPQAWPLTISRDSRFTGVAVGAKVTLDGIDCGQISSGQTLTYTVPGQIVHVSLKIWSMPVLNVRLRLCQNAHLTFGIKLGAFVNKLVVKDVAGAEVLECS